MSNKENVLRQLDTLGIPYVCYDHPAAYTMQDCYELPFVTPELLFCKNLLLCNRQQTSFYLLVISPERTFRTAEVSHELGVSRLSFAPEDALPRLLGLEKGAVSPLRRTGKIAFHPCDNRATVVFDQEIFWQRVVPGLAHEYTFVL